MPEEEEDEEGEESNPAKLYCIMLLAKQWKLFTDYRAVLGVVNVCV
jgi:hypothetical protein